MSGPRGKRRLAIAAIVAIVFGILTLLSGGLALFGGAEARAAMGQIVPLVLWFNFLAGFAYVTAGVGLWARRRWAGWVSVAVMAATFAVPALLGLHILRGGAYEMRTVIAMGLGTAIWMGISWVAFADLVRSRQLAQMPRRGAVIGDPRISPHVPGTRRTTTDPG